MLGTIFHALIYLPLYNALILLVDFVPRGDVGIALIALTMLVKLLLFPVSQSAARTQREMQVLQPKLKDIQLRHKDDKEVLGRKTLELYKEHKVNPFSSILALFIQLPIIFGLYMVFYKGGLPIVHVADLYSFVHQPSGVNMQFLNLIDMSGKSLLLALLAGLTQFAQANLSLPPVQPAKQGASFGEDFARSFSLQARYVLPVFIAFLAYTISAAVALYWTVSNLFMIGQELYLRRGRTATVAVETKKA